MGRKYCYMSFHILDYMNVLSIQKIFLKSKVEKIVYDLITPSNKDPPNYLHIHIPYLIRIFIFSA